MLTKDIRFMESWEQAVTWLVLLVVLYSMVSGKIRYDLTAFGGLLLLGILGLREPSKLFSGFSSPALFAIVIVLVMSAGIVESGLLSGFSDTALPPRRIPPGFRRSDHGRVYQGHPL